MDCTILNHPCCFTTIYCKREDYLGHFFQAFRHQIQASAYFKRANGDEIPRDLLGGFNDFCFNIRPQKSRKTTVFDN